MRRAGDIIANPSDSCQPPMECPAMPEKGWFRIREVGESVPYGRLENQQGKLAASPGEGQRVDPWARMTLIASASSPNQEASGVPGFLAGSEESPPCRKNGV